VKCSRCDLPGRARGLCSTHYWQDWRDNCLPSKEWVNKHQLCCVEGCHKPANCKGRCKSHYENLRRYGHERADSELSDWELVERRGWTVTSEGCWEYSGFRNSHGYGEIRDRKRVHRISYEHHTDLIPPGLHVLHSCDNPPCLNPEHLRVGTHEENMLDMKAKDRGRWAGMTQCPNGHPYDASNDLGRGNHVRCLTCDRERKRRWQEKNRGSVTMEKLWEG
jgi:HNH endonuclease